MFVCYNLTEISAEGSDGSEESVPGDHDDVPAAGVHHDEEGESGNSDGEGVLLSALPLQVFDCCLQLCNVAGFCMLV